MAAGLVACNNDDATIAENGALDGDKVFMQVKLEMPQTRANGDPIEEQGTAEESAVKTLQLVLVNPDNKVIVATSDVVPQAATKGNVYVAEFQSEFLKDYADVQDEKPLNLIAYCNTKCGQAAGNILNLDKIANDATKAWSNVTGFWMTNANDNDMQFMLPNRAELDKHNTEDNPLALTTVAVERVAARFDIAANSNKFLLKGTVEAPEIEIQLDDVALFNMPKDAYYLRRVSDNGENITDWNGLFGKAEETASMANGVANGGVEGLNYVVDTKSDKSTFNYTEAEQLEFTKLSTLGTEDNWGAPGEYYFWRYAVENTTSPNIEQNEDVTTGVAFRGHIVAADKCEAGLKGIIDAGTETIYVYNDIMYGSWDRVKRVAEQGFVNGNEGAKFEEDLALEGAYKNAVEILAANPELGVEGAAAKADFKVFKAQNGKYPIYYNYYNQHLDNNKDKEMGVMEYAVVRNNVYKLKVNGISQFGDPEWRKPTPTPIEHDNVYFKVTVQVLPWTVRVNNIEL